jgi:hypothetical protein
MSEKMTKQYIFVIENNLQKLYHAGLDINVCPIPVKTDVGQVDLVLRLSDGTSEKMTVLPFEGYFLWQKCIALSFFQT